MSDTDLVPCPVCQGTKESPYSPQSCQCCKDPDGQPTGTITAKRRDILRRISNDIRQRAAERRIDLDY